MKLYSIVDFLTTAMNFLSGIFDRRRAYKDELRKRIADARKRLSDALSEGRLSDVPAIKAELEELEKEYKRARTAKTARTARTGISGAEVLAPALIASAALMSGCVSGRPHTAVLVEGSRILLVDPGKELVVPELEKPARQWYLVDDVALLHWLGVSVSESK